MIDSPYFPQVESDEHFRLAEAIPGPTTTRLGELAYELGVVIVASLFEIAIANPVDSLHDRRIHDESGVLRCDLSSAWWCRIFF